MPASSRSATMLTHPTPCRAFEYSGRHLVFPVPAPSKLQVAVIPREVRRSTSFSPSVIQTVSPILPAASTAGRLYRTFSVPSAIPLTHPLPLGCLIENLLGT